MKGKGYTPSSEQRSMMLRYRNSMIWKLHEPPRAFEQAYMHHDVILDERYSIETWRDGKGGLFSNVEEM